jgi:integrase
MSYTFQQFLETKRAPRSVMAARVGLSQFLTFIYPDSEEEIELLSVRYIKENVTNPQHFTNLLRFVKYLDEKGDAPNTLHGKYANVLTWLKWNDVVFSPAESGRLKSVLPRRVTVHDEGDLTKDKIVSLLSHSDVMMRAVILVLVSSGMRIGECLSIRSEQLQGNEVHLERQQMKAGKPHVYFVSREAVKAIDEWFKVRDVNLERSRKKAKKCLGVLLASSGDDPRIFPYSQSVVSVKFVNLQKKAGTYEYDGNAKRGRITLHSFRKFTDSTMNLHISKNMTNALIGHFEYGDGAYRRYSREQLRDAYSAVEPHLVMLAPPEYAEDMSEYNKRLNNQNSTLAIMADELVQQQKSLEEYKDNLESIKMELARTRFMSYFQEAAELAQKACPRGFDEEKEREDQKRLDDDPEGFLRSFMASINAKGMEFVREVEDEFGISRTESKSKKTGKRRDKKN